MATLMKTKSGVFYDPQQAFFGRGESTMKSVATWKKWFSPQTGKYYGSRAQAEKAQAYSEAAKEKPERWPKLKKSPAFMGWHSVPMDIRKQASGHPSWEPWTAFFNEYGWDPVAIGSALSKADENGYGELETLLDEWESLI